MTPGALLFAVGWVVASLVFALYLSKFGSYHHTFGSLGAVIVLLVWLYRTNMPLLVGGELTAALANLTDTTYTCEHGPRPDERRLASAA